MNMRDLLSQYELDSVQAPLREKYNFNRLSGKTVVVSGSSRLVRAIALSLLVCNGEKQLGMRIFLHSAQKFGELDGAEGISRGLPKGKPDFWIETDFYEVAENLDCPGFTEKIRRADSVLSDISAASPARVLLVSNTRCYGNAENEILFSEKEQGAESGELCTLQRSVENLFFCAAKQSGFDLTVIRAADLIADFSNSARLSELLSKASSGDEVALNAHSRKNSYIYINDLLTSIVFLLLQNETGAFNACGDMTVNSARLGAELVSVCGCPLSVNANGEELSGAAVDNTRLKKLGWQPEIALPDALLMAIKSMSGDDGVFMFPDAYDGKLTAVQSVLLGFLKEVDRICKKHNIKYFLGGGSLLGAIRHHGFIPWDDDADVMMLRDDYEKFLSVLPDELPNFVFAQTGKNESASHFPFTKLRIDNTVLSTEFSARFPEIHNGVFLDVLAQDKTSKNRLAQRLHIKLTAQLRWLVLNKWRKTPVDANNRFVSFGANILKAVIPLRVLERMQNGIMKIYRNKNTGLLYDSMGRNVERGAFPECWLDKAVYVDFEDTRLPVPAEYDKYLNYLYGDYMSMVPVSLRHVSHDIVRIDLGAYLNYNSEGKISNC